MGIAQYLKAGTFFRIDHFFFIWIIDTNLAVPKMKETFDVNGEFFAVLPLLISLLYIIPHLDRI